MTGSVPVICSQCGKTVRGLVRGPRSVELVRPHNTPEGDPCRGHRYVDHQVVVR